MRRYMAWIFADSPTTSKPMKKSGQVSKMTLGTGGRPGQGSDRKIRLDIHLLHNPIVLRYTQFEVYFLKFLTYVCMHACICVCMYVCMYVCACMYVCMYVCMHVCMHACMY